MSSAIFEDPDRTAGSQTCPDFIPGKNSQLQEIVETDCDNLLGDVVENCFVVKFAPLPSAWGQEQVEFSERRMVDFVNASRRR